MTDHRMALIEAFQKADDGNFLRSLAETVLQILMEADVEGLIGAGRYERSGERSTYRNRYRERSLDTRLGSLNLKIPKLRTRSYFPGFLEPRKTVEKALVAVIQEAWIAGVSTRRVDDLMQAMGLSPPQKAALAREFVAGGRPVSAVASALGVSRLHLASLRQPVPRRRGRPPAPDAELLPLIRALVADLPTYGYRRVHALLRRQAEQEGRPAPNVKRVYRVMKVHGLGDRNRQTPRRFTLHLLQLLPACPG